MIKLRLLYRNPDFYRPSSPDMRPFLFNDIIISREYASVDAYKEHLIEEGFSINDREARAIGEAVGPKALNGGAVVVFGDDDGFEGIEIVTVVSEEEEGGCDAG